MVGDDFSRLETSRVSLKLIPPYFMRRYGVRQVFSTAGAETVLKYEMEITYKKTIAEGLRLFELNRFDQLYINNEVPDSIADELAFRTGQVFFPLQVLVDFAGRYVSVYNLVQIRERWTVLKKELLEFFAGEEVETYFGYQETVLMDQDKINDIFGKDILIRAYFAGLYQNYVAEKELDSLLYFPLTGHAAPVLFSVKETLVPHYNSSGQLEIIHKGTADDDRSIADILRYDDYATSRDDDQSLEKIKADYKARYALNAETRSIEAMEASWMMFLDREEITSISMYEISGLDELTEKEVAAVNAAEEKKDQPAGPGAKFMKILFG